MNYSNFHYDFANNLLKYKRVHKQDVLDHPENYLGPNYKEVLNYWFYLESWNYEQWRVYLKRLCLLSYEITEKAYQTSRELASEVIDPRFLDHFHHRELEIISAHLYIKHGIPFTFFPLIFDL